MSILCCPLNIKEYLEKQRHSIQKTLESLVTEKNVPQHALFRAARYSLLGPGKRLRPLLALTTVDTLQGDHERALIPVCSLEMIHAYSLIHDDLPCMDDDDFRRGLPTLHKVYGEANALLAGDYLLTFAFENLACHGTLDPATRVQLIALLAQKSGGDGMIGGQFLDLEAETMPLNSYDVTLIHQLKTGALIVGAIEFGAILSNASNEQLSILRSFGQKVGLAFQIIDDVIDVTAGIQKHGKQQGSDASNGKATFISLYGVEESQRQANLLLQEAKDCLSQLTVDTSLLSALADHLVIRSI